MHLVSEVHLLMSLPVCGRAVQGAQKPGEATQGEATGCMLTVVLLALSTSTEDTERTCNSCFNFRTTGQLLRESIALV